MASKASSVEDSPMEVEETKQEKGLGKPRHKFTKHELEILNRSFEQNSYPDFGTRQELAKQMHCPISSINAPQGNAGSFLMETWGLPSEENGSCDSFVLDGQQVAREQPSSPKQQVWGEGYELFDGLPLPCVNSAHGKMQQQQDMDLFDLWGPQQQSDWGYYNLQLQQPQSYQEKLPVQDPLLLSEKHNVLGQQLPSFPQEQDVDSQKNGEDSRTQIECTSTPQMELSVLPEPIALDGQQVAREQPRSPNQQVWGEGYELFDDLPLPCDNSVQAMMQQQQDIDLLDLWGPQQQSDWGYYNPQLQQPQSYQEKLPVQDPILMSPTEQRYETFDDLAEILTEVLGIEF
ncbi:cytoplasmic polyadenylated homeobox-like protein 2 [Marmota marmota marmota]|uniref:cytoplasmic polyadenylated homeobox-like protein 2 n=1 Tax=Marmota marmota marmota TaxID=9994 RepID=UPI002092D0DF|nr:cytoplasmic polyadenylated homeobox-like protein 2 [Marmota marmota marmota]